MIKEHFTTLGNNPNNSSLINHLKSSVNSNSSHNSFDVIGTIAMVIINNLSMSGNSTQKT